MRAVIYARYSTDLQSAASIEDQVRLCRERLERDGHDLVKIYSDRAISGATLLRPGVQLLMQDATGGAFDHVYAEALDRISRDQEDAAGFFKRMAFAEVTFLLKMWTMLWSSAFFTGWSNGPCAPSLAMLLGRHLGCGT